MMMNICYFNSFQIRYQIMSVCIYSFLSVQLNFNLRIFYIDSISILIDSNPVFSVFVFWGYLSVGLKNCHDVMFPDACVFFYLGDFSWVGFSFDANMLLSHLSLGCITYILPCSDLSLYLKERYHCYTSCRLLSICFIKCFSIYLGRGHNLDKRGNVSCVKWLICCRCNHSENYLNED